MIRVTLKPGREKPVLGGHPWIFSGSIAKADGYAVPGEICTVMSSKSEMLGCGYYNPVSAINVRMLAKGI
jgi:23S rRNA (cytosine1962-C5)-methyltransferase